MKKLLFLAALIFLSPAWAGANEKVNEGAIPMNEEKSAQKEGMTFSVKMPEFRVFWKDGLYFETRDRSFQMNIGGRIHYDVMWGQSQNKLDDILPAPGLKLIDGAELRRGRFYIKGVIYKHFLYMLEYDWPSGTGAAVLKDAYVGVKPMDGVEVLVGNMKEPFSLEELTSDNVTTFIERGLPNMYSPHYRAGIKGTFNPAKGMVASFGIFRNSNGTGFEQENGGYSLTGRFSFAPLYDSKSGNLFHVGFGMSTRSMAGASKGFDTRTRPEAHLAFNSWAGTTTLLLNHLHFFGVEAAMVLGPLSFQAEYIAAIPEATLAQKAGRNNPFWYSFYGYVSFFLTGEHRTYDPNKGCFGGVKPKKNFLDEGGLGAIEAALRLSYVDSSQGGYNFGELMDVTLGVNWYLNPNMRIMANYVAAMLEHQGTNVYNGTGHIFEMRFQINF